MENKKINDINIKEEILNKEFNLDYKGYNLLEVDQFLDWLSIYFEVLQTQEKKSLKQVTNLQNQLETLMNENKKLLEENALLKRQKKALEDKGLENADILSRLTKLESIVND